MTSNNPYGKRANGGMHGDVFTKLEVVQYMLDLVGYVSDRNLSELSAIEPSCGEGEILIEMLRRLYKSSLKYGFDFNEAIKKGIVACELDAKKIESCHGRIADEFPQISNFGIIHQGDFLEMRFERTFDIVIGNPPYVRYENLTEEMKQRYKQKFPTFYYRADLYVPFYEKTLRMLRRGGQHCFICSNRWLKNEYGKKLRRFVAEDFRLERIIDLEQAQPFQENVLAYTDIVLVSANAPSQDFLYAEANDVSKLDDAIFKTKPSPVGEDWSDAFRSEDCGDTMTIEEQGFRIGIGVATGASNVFVSETLPEEVEAELLLPAVCAKDLRGNQFHWNGQYLLNPYDAQGRLIPLSRYPRLASYLHRYEEKLRGRHVAQKNKDNWYRTIDRIYPELTSQPKILLPDMSGNNRIFIDNGKFYPLHNIYYITGPAEQLPVLAAMLMSNDVQEQLSSLTNAMHGGYTRWQSQHLRKLQLPVLSAISTDTANAFREGFIDGDLVTINSKMKLVKNQKVERHEKKRHKEQELVLDFAWG